jgi:hypothetical protein
VLQVLDLDSRESDAASILAQMEAQLLLKLPGKPPRIIFLPRMRCDLDAIVFDEPFFVNRDIGVLVALGLIVLGGVIVRLAGDAPLASGLRTEVIRKSDGSNGGASSTAPSSASESATPSDPPAPSCVQNKASS